MGKARKVTKTKVYRLGGGLSVKVKPPSKIDEVLGFKCGKITFTRKKYRRKKKE